MVLPNKEYIIHWEDDSGKEHTIKVYPPITLYIGRPTRDLLIKANIDDPYQVYIFYEGKDYAIPTGIRDCTVSRKHVKIVISDSKIELMDHGPLGTGSKNGTYVNELKIAKRAIVTLKSGDRIKLGPRGPIFTLIEKRKEERTPTLEVVGGIPQEVPRSIASKLIREGAVEESIELDKGKILVVPREGAKADIGIAKVQVRRVTEKEREEILIHNLQKVLYEATLHLKENRVKEAVIELSKIQVKAYKRLIENLGDEKVRQAYEEITYYIKQESPPIDMLEDKIKLLIRLLDVIIKVGEGYV